VVIKLSQLKSSSAGVYRGPAILTCAARRYAGDRIDADPGWFVPCAQRDDRYQNDVLHYPQVDGISPSEMKAVIDSLLQVPELREGRIDPADSVTLSLRRVVNGHERIYEATLDGSACWEVWRITRSLGRHAAGLAYFWGQVDWRLGSRWGDAGPAVRVKRLLPLGPRTQDPALASLVGYIKDSVTGKPIAQAQVRLYNPIRTAVTDDEGGFSFRDLPPDKRILMVNAPDHEMGFAPMEFHAGAIDTLILRVPPNGETPPRVLSFDRHEPWYPTSGTTPAHVASLKVRVSDGSGAALAGAQVLLVQGDTQFGGLVDSSGVLLFPAVSLATARLHVRAANYQSFTNTIEFREGTRVSLDVHLRPGAP